jgi:hypothetical protein
MQMSALLQQYSRNAIKRKRDDVKGSSNNNSNADNVNTTTLPTTTTTTTTTDVNELPHFLIIVELLYNYKKEQINVRLIIIIYQYKYNDDVLDSSIK